MIFLDSGILVTLSYVKTLSARKVFRKIRFRKKFRKAYALRKRVRRYNRQDGEVFKGNSTGI